jgi:hypothetical protein
LDFFFIYFDCVFFFTVKIKNNKIGKEKKFINVRLKGEKLNTVIEPNINGKQNITKNLLFNMEVKLISYN